MGGGQFVTTHRGTPPLNLGFGHTDDFARDHERMSAAGVRFLEAPHDERHGTGNTWDLIENHPSR